MRGSGSLASSTSSRVYLDPTRIAGSTAVRRPQVKGKLIQGKLREENSSAAKLYRRREAIRLRKALESLTHGKTIFAYNHLRTNQVVYSFSRELRDNKILPQLIFHRKKTVPAKIRPDMWVPYFSVHFTNPKLGLHTYRLLRQFTVRRQLTPPEDMITNTEEWIAKRRPNDPNEAEKYDRTWKARKGQIMVKKDRAKVLMDQKATSVADLATALSVVWEKEEKAEKAQKRRKNQDPKSKKKESKAVRRRQRKAREEREAREAQIRSKIAELEKVMSTKMGSDVKITNAPEKLHYNLEDGKFMVLWNDIQNQQYSEWPENVIHRELRPIRSHTIGHALKPEPPATKDKEIEVAEQDEEAPTAQETEKDDATQKEEKETGETKKPESLWSKALQRLKLGRK